MSSNRQAIEAEEPEAGRMAGGHEDEDWVEDEELGEDMEKEVIEMERIELVILYPEEEEKKNTPTVAEMLKKTPARSSVKKATRVAKGVQWGTSCTRLFEWCQGFDSVPSDKRSPSLAMRNEHHLMVTESLAETEDFARTCVGAGGRREVSRLDYYGRDDREGLLEFFGVAVEVDGEMEVLAASRSRGCRCGGRCHRTICECRIAGVECWDWCQCGNPTFCDHCASDPSAGCSDHHSLSCGNEKREDRMAWRREQRVAHDRERLGRLMEMKEKEGRFFFREEELKKFQPLPNPVGTIKLHEEVDSDEFEMEEGEEENVENEGEEDAEEDLDMAVAAAGSNDDGEDDGEDPQMAEVPGLDNGVEDKGEDTENDLETAVAAADSGNEERRSRGEEEAGEGALEMAEVAESDDDDNEGDDEGDDEGEEPVVAGVSAEGEDGQHRLRLVMYPRYQVFDEEGGLLGHMQFHEDDEEEEVVGEEDLENPVDERVEESEGEGSDDEMVENEQLVENPVDERIEESEDEGSDDERVENEQLVERIEFVPHFNDILGNPVEERAEEPEIEEDEEMEDEQMVERQDLVPQYERMMELVSERFANLRINDELEEEEDVMEETRSTITIASDHIIDQIDDDLDVVLGDGRGDGNGSVNGDGSGDEGSGDDAVSVASIPPPFVLRRSTRLRKPVDRFCIPLHVPKRRGKRAGGVQKKRRRRRRARRVQVPAPPPPPQPPRLAPFKTRALPPTPAGPPPVSRDAASRTMTLAEAGVELKACRVFFNASDYGSAGLDILLKLKRNETTWSRLSSPNVAITPPMERSFIANIVAIRAMLGRTN